jgi:rhodanese-related sulfurtransferase
MKTLRSVPIVVALSLALLAAWPSSHAAASEVVQIDVVQAQKLAGGGVKVIDVRRADEWRATGVIDGSLLLTAFDANGRLDDSFIAAVQQRINTDEPVVLICRSGNRSAAASRLLVETLGYRHVYNAAGGINRWIANGNAVVPCPSC